MSLKIPAELLQRKPYLQIYAQEQIGQNPFQLLAAKKPEEYLLQLDQKKLASAISPKTQAERSLPAQGFTDTDLVIVLGLGNPHLAHSAHKRLKPGQILLLIDAHPASFYPLWQPFLAEILEVEGRHIFLSENSLSLLWNYIDSLPIERLSALRYLRNPSSIQLEPQFYQQIEAKIHKVFSSKMSDLLTKFEFERIWIKNTLCNTLNFSQKTPTRFKIKRLFGIAKNIPGLLVSAGPTLRHHCPWIQTIRDKVFLLSCDTSLKVLQKFGIMPDAVMTLDAQTHSFFHFMGSNLANIPVFADMVTSPALLRSLNTKAIVHSITAKFQVDASGTPIRETTSGSETAEKILGSIGDIQSGGSVATTAFDVLKNLGCSPIFLVGQDLAYTGREIHSTGTHHNEKWLTLVNRRQSLENINEAVVRKRNTDYIPSCNGGKVLTDYVLKIYKQWFEESAASLDTTIYNVNSGGAYLEYINNISIIEAQQLFLDFDDHHYPWQSLPVWKPESQKVMALPEDIREKFWQQIQTLQDEIKQMADDSMDDSNLIRQIEQKLSDVSYLKKMLRKIDVYLRRHKDLSPEKKKQLLIDSLRKELRYLKKGIMFQ